MRVRNAVLIGSIAGLMSIGAHAQTVYRCVVDGKTTFSQMPCAPNAERVNAAPAAGQAAPGAAERARSTLMQQQMRVDRANAGRVREQAFNERIREIERDSAKRQKKLDCDFTAIDRRSAEYLADNYVMPENIRRAESDARSLRTREFMDDCR